MVGDPVADHVDHNYNKCHRSCVVPLCPNTTEKTPEKLFVPVPSANNTREEWLRLAGCLPMTTGMYYFCEDHFNLQNDMINYMEYKVMGHVKRVRLKVGSLPSKFECQQQHKILPLNQKCDNMFKINVVQGQNVFTIETIPRTESTTSIEEETMDKDNKTKILDIVPKKTEKKPTIIKVKKLNDFKQTHKKKPIIIKTKVKIIKK